MSERGIKQWLIIHDNDSISNNLDYMNEDIDMVSVTLYNYSFKHKSREIKITNGITIRFIDAKRLQSWYPLSTKQELSALIAALDYLLLWCKTYHELPLAITYSPDATECT